jgi:hypothetical protein
MGVKCSSYESTKKEKNPRKKEIKGEAGDSLINALR